MRVAGSVRRTRTLDWVRLLAHEPSGLLMCTKHRLVRSIPISQLAAPVQLDAWHPLGVVVLPQLDASIQLGVAALVQLGAWHPLGVAAPVQLGAWHPLGVAAPVQLDASIQHLVGLPQLGAVDLVSYVWLSSPSLWSLASWAVTKAPLARNAASRRSVAATKQESMMASAHREASTEPHRGSDRV